MGSSPGVSKTTTTTPTDVSVDIKRKKSSVTAPRVFLSTRKKSLADASIAGRTETESGPEPKTSTGGMSVSMQTGGGETSTCSKGTPTSTDVRKRRRSSLMGGSRIVESGKSPISELGQKQVLTIGQLMPFPKMRRIFVEPSKPEVKVAELLEPNPKTALKDRTNPRTSSVRTRSMASHRDKLSDHYDNLDNLPPEAKRALEATTMQEKMLLVPHYAGIPVHSHKHFERRAQRQICMNKVLALIGVIIILLLACVVFVVVLVLLYEESPSNTTKLDDNDTTSSWTQIMIRLPTAS